MDKNSNSNSNNNNSNSNSNNNNNNSKSKFLTPQDEIYKAIKNNKCNYEPSKCKMGYEDRFYGITELKLVDFNPKSTDIPWHRIYYFSYQPDKKDGEDDEPEPIRIWDRLTKTDLVTGSGVTNINKELFIQVGDHAHKRADEILQGVLATNKGREKFERKLIAHQLSNNQKVTSTTSRSSSTTSSGRTIVNPLALKQISANFAFLPFYIFAKKRWREARSDEVGKAVNKLKIVTWNVLFETHNPELIHSEIRIEALLAELKQVDPDIVGLQEVTANFLSYLLEEDWVKKNYFISECGTSDLQTVTPYGQVILSKFRPHSLIQHNFSTHKKLIIFRICLNGRLVNIPVIHLTSDHKSYCDKKRTRQLAVIFQELTKKDAIILGDFNFGCSPNARKSQSQKFLETIPNCTDMWPTLHPNEQGYTMDPTINPLAKLNSTSQQQKRLDRILLVHSPGIKNKMIPLSIKMIGTNTIKDAPEVTGYGPLHPSDHFGLFAEIQMPEDIAQTEELQESTCSQTDVSITFEDEAKRNTMQHEQKCLSSFAADIQSKSITTEKKEILSLFSNVCIQALHCCTNSKSQGKLFAIGSFGLGISDENSDVDLVFLSFVKFNGGRIKFFREVIMLLHEKGVLEQYRIVENAIVPVLKLTLETNVEIDLLFAEYSLRDKPISEVLIETSNATLAPGLATEYLNLNDTTYNQLDAATKYSIQGIQDTHFILSTLTSDKLAPNYIQVFQAAFTLIKLWAKNRKIYGSSYCFFGGISFVVMLTKVVQTMFDSNTTTKQENESFDNMLQQLLQTFFATYATWDWSTPVFVCNDTIQTADFVKFKMPIITPSKPYRNTTRNITSSTFEIITKEFCRANDIISKANKDDSFTATFLTVLDVKPFFYDSAAFIVVHVECDSWEDLEQCTGWMNSSLIQLITALEKASTSKSLIAYPLPKSYAQLHLQKSKPNTAIVSLTYFIGLANKFENTNENCSNSIEQAIRNFTGIFKYEWKAKPNNSCITILQKSATALRKSKWLLPQGILKQ